VGSPTRVVGRLNAPVTTGTIDMNLTNDSYLILLGTRNFTERYYRDKKGWLKVSAQGRRFRMTAEQVLNHILPALAGIKPNVTIGVEHHDLPVQNEQSAQPSDCRQGRDRLSVGNRTSLARPA
jgi:hypothetical protein